MRLLKPLSLKQEAEDNHLLFQRAILVIEETGARQYMLTTDEKIALFGSLFSGLTNVYGTYDPNSGKHWQVKQPVTRNVLYEHLQGVAPYGFYPLIGDKTHVGIADFDDGNPEPAIELALRARHYKMAAYLEKSKSKGYHVWIFFSKAASARKVRIVIRHILHEIESPNIEVFPKQDFISGSDSFGNFINAPLFGKLVPEGKTVFIQPDANLRPFSNQWAVLDSINRVGEDTLDWIIELNNLEKENNKNQDNKTDFNTHNVTGYSLPVCIRRMLNEGVTFNQRVACFRIAVHLKRVGLPYDAVIAILTNWRFKNRPKRNKRIITNKEIEEQVSWAFKKDYTGYGCNERIIESHCDPKCPIKLKDGR